MHSHPEEPRRGTLSRFAHRLESCRTSTAAGGFVALGAAVLLWCWAQPTNRRRWRRGQHRLATNEISGNKVTIRNLRCFRWNLDGPPNERYLDRSYDLERLHRLDFIVTRFGMKGLAAHTMLSFGFEDGEQLVLSIEIRRREGQHFSILQGLFRSFELQYIFGEERDLVHLRTNIQNDATYLYPVKVDPESVRRLLLSVLERANAVAENPEFYNSLKNACTTNLIRHFNAVGLCKASERGPRTVVSGLSDGLLHDLGLIGEGTKLRALRKIHRINERARACGDDSEFSRRIRENSPSDAP
ncbi:MAG: DUF4105 domain-containing protein [Elusimicrobiota bacterium]